MGHPALPVAPCLEGRCVGLQGLTSKRCVEAANRFGYIQLSPQRHPDQRSKTNQNCRTLDFIMWGCKTTSSFGVLIAVRTGLIERSLLACCWCVSVGAPWCRRLGRLASRPTPAPPPTPVRRSAAANPSILIPSIQLTHRLASDGPTGEAAKAPGGWRITPPPLHSTAYQTMAEPSTGSGSGPVPDNANEGT